MSAPKLTAAERTERDLLESVILAGLASFVDVGTALQAISDRQLYRETHPTFQIYCSAKWGFTARRAYQLCDAAKIVAGLPPGENVNNCSQITNEAQARGSAGSRRSRAHGQENPRGDQGIDEAHPFTGDCNRRERG